MRDEADLAGEIKAFRKKFKAEHGKDPSRKDMNRYPAIAETYDAWLMIKSANSASTSASANATSSSTLKRKSALTNSPKKRNVESRFGGDEASTSMGPPPTTPSKKKPKKVTYTDIAERTSTFKTPTKKSGAASPSSSVHDSGGSVVDVPSTPKQDSPTSPSTFASRWNYQKRNVIPQKSPSKYIEYESPRKIKELLSSFSSIQRTPTKERDKEEELIQRLTKGPRPAYTPRTKARKRLRGEVVITPEKVARIEEGKGTADQLKKKRRGMAATTLKDFGLVPVAAPPKGRATSSRSIKEVQKERKSEKSVLRQELDDEGMEDDDEDEILGPSPSVNRTIDRPVKSFQPLFAPKVEDASPSMEVIDKADVVAKASEEERASLAQEASEKKLNGILHAAEDEEDAGIEIVAYRPFGRNNSSTLYDTALSDEEDEGMGIYSVTAAVDATSPIPDEDVTSDEDASPVLNALTLNSPQLKKARRRQKVKAERDIRHLLGTDDSLLHLAEEEVDEEGKVEAPKTNKVGPPIKGGKLRKGFRDVNRNSKAEKAKSAVKSVSTKKPRMILQNTREQLGSDEESDYGDGSDDDDEWASEVSSAEYGLGDGYMSDL